MTYPNQDKILQLVKDEDGQNNFGAVVAYKAIEFNVSNPETLVAIIDYCIANKITGSKLHILYRDNEEDGKNIIQKLGF